MNKTELVKVIMEKNGLSKKEVETVLNSFIEVVGETLQNKEKIQLAGFGTFETRERAAREGRNPKNRDQIIQIPATTTVAFKVSSKLKDLVNNK